MADIARIEVLANVYADALTEDETREVEAIYGGDLPVHASGLLAVAEFAAVQARAEPHPDEPDLTKLLAESGEPVDRLTSVVAIMVEQVSRIADNLTRTDNPVTVEQVIAAWDAVGMRADEDLAIAFVKALPGVTVLE